MSKLHTALVILGAAFLAYLLWTVGPGQLWNQVRALGWTVIPLILSEGLANLAHTVGWRYCLSRSEAPVALLRGDGGAKIWPHSNKTCPKWMKH